MERFMRRIAREVAEHRRNLHEVSEAMRYEDEAVFSGISNPWDRWELEYMARLNRSTMTDHDYESRRLSVYIPKSLGWQWSAESDYRTTSLTH